MWIFHFWLWSIGGGVCCLQTFFTGKIGLCTAESSHSIIIPDFKKGLKYWSYTIDGFLFEWVLFEARPVMWFRTHYQWPFAFNEAHMVFVCGAEWRRYLWQLWNLPLRLDTSLRVCVFLDQLYCSVCTYSCDPCRATYITTSAKPSEDPPHHVWNL